MHLAGLLVASVLVAAAEDDALLRIYQEAKAAEASGDFKAASDRYEKIVAMQPDMAEAHANLGNLYYVQGRADQAAAAFRRAIRLKPSLAAPHRFLGILLFRRREFTAAETHLTNAVKLDAADPMGYEYLGYTRFAAQRYGEAVAALNAAVERDATNLDAWYHLSKAHSSLSRDYFEKLQKRFPADFHTRLARSHFYEGEGNWALAKEELEHALRVRPDARTLKPRLDWLARRQAGADAGPPDTTEWDGAARYLHSPPEGENLQEAMTRERGASAVPPASSPEALYRLADSHQALSFLTALGVMQADPESYRAHQLRGQLLETAGKTTEAIESYRQTLQVKPELETIHFAIGNIYWRLGQFDQAAPELEAELKLNPSDANAQYELADILLSRGEAVEAEKRYRESLRLAPGMVEAHLALERIASGRGETAAALAHLQKAAALDPSNSTPHYRLWLLYRKLGRTVEAGKAKARFEALRAKERNKPGA